MTALTIVDLAGSLARAVGCSFVIVEAENAGSEHRLAQSFPSLDEDAVDQLHGQAVALRFDETADAQAAFNRLTADLRAADEEHGGLVEATVRYVGTIPGGPVVTTSNSFGSRHRAELHFFHAGQLGAMSR